jgi:hypothetical protein
MISVKVKNTVRKKSALDLSTDVLDAGKNKEEFINFCNQLENVHYTEMKKEFSKGKVSL